MSRSNPYETMDESDIEHELALISAFEAELHRLMGRITEAKCEGFSATEIVTDMQAVWDDTVGVAQKQAQDELDARVPRWDQRELAPRVL